MEELSMTPARRLHAHRAYGHAVEAFDTVAWRAPSAHRFDSRPANDFNWRTAPERAQAGPNMPRWLVILGGAVIAAVVGALLGGMLAV
jgi:hypothetical protein